MCCCRFRCLDIFCGLLKHCAVVHHMVLALLSVTAHTWLMCCCVSQLCAACARVSVSTGFGSCARVPAPARMCRHLLVLLLACCARRIWQRLAAALGGHRGVVRGGGRRQHPCPPRARRLTPMMACPSHPCPWCTLRVPHGGVPSQDITRALHHAREELESERITGFQYGMLCFAAAELLHRQRVASSPSEAMSFVHSMAQRPFTAWGASRSAPSSSMPPPPPPASVFRGKHPGSVSANVPRDPPALTAVQRFAVQQAAAAATLPPDVTSGVTGPAEVAQPTTPPEASAAISASGRMAPAGESSSASGSVEPSVSALAIVPCQPGPAHSAYSEPRPAPVAWTWQVQTGTGKKRKWTVVSDDLAALLEDAHANGLQSCTWDWDGWVYTYDMLAMIQRSPGEAGTERPIRRIRAHETSFEG